MDETHSSSTGYLAIAKAPLSNCRCNPKVQWVPEKEVWLIIHGAFDGREAMEETLQILNHQK